MLHKKWSILLNIFSVNVTESAAYLDIFTEEILGGKLHFLCSVEKKKLWPRQLSLYSADIKSQAANKVH